MCYGHSISPPSLTLPTNTTLVVSANDGRDSIAKCGRNVKIGLLCVLSENHTHIIITNFAFKSFLIVAITLS